MADEFTLKGLDGVLKTMRTLAPKLQKRALRAALRKGGNIVKAAAVANARQLDDPETANNIAKNVTIQAASRLGKSEGGDAIRVGIIGGARQYVNSSRNRRMGRVGATYLGGVADDAPGGRTWYWRMLELGTSRQRARPFLRPALENNIQPVINAFALEMERQIDKAVKS